MKKIMGLFLALLVVTEVWAEEISKVKVTFTGMHRNAGGAYALYQAAYLNAAGNFYRPAMADKMRSAKLIALGLQSKSREYYHQKNYAINDDGNTFACYQDKQSLIKALQCYAANDGRSCREELQKLIKYLTALNDKSVQYSTQKLYLVSDNGEGGSKDYFEVYLFSAAKDQAKKYSFLVAGE